MGKKKTGGILSILIAAACLFAGCSGAEDKNKTEIKLINEATEGSETPVEQETEPEELSRIICWGDSLTFGQGGEGVTFPSVLQEHLPGVQVVNYGIQGETAQQIAIRAGGLPMSVSAFTIPADSTPVQVYLWQGGEDPIMMRLGDAGINPCSIAGVEGTLSYDPGEVKYYFARTKAGEAVDVAEQTVVATFGDADKRSSDVIVLFAGTNRPPDKYTVQSLVNAEWQILKHIGSRRYVVIGLTSKELVPDVAEINQALGEAFGERFLDIRSYFLEHGLEDAGITASEQDLADIGRGEVPSSLRVDVVHGNSEFYRLMGEQVYKKMIELGYLSP